ncbi:hypothetical protein AAF712_009653 [Marasmius tenuissimus]|uniref:Uncharacterized protein n=1 Tax=Marasmius tenuissimus TaxID=585030 RepID=A0ABR2ZR17_9AGAR
MEATTIHRPSQSLASPIRLTPPYPNGLATPRPAYGYGPSGEQHRQMPRSLLSHPYASARPAPRKSSPLSMHDSGSAMTAASVHASHAVQKPSPLKAELHPANVTPARRVQIPGAPPPMILSPLKVMFDNTCRGIYSELSYLQSSCTAIVNRERKEKEVLRAHYFQMRRERDAVRERLQALEQASCPSFGSPAPTRKSPTPVKRERTTPLLQLRPILKKRSRDEAEAGDLTPSSASSSCSSLSRSPSPRTPSPTFQPHRVAISPIDDGPLELVYPGAEATETTHTRVLVSPPPPPISARKMYFLPPPTSTPNALTRNYSLPSLSPVRPLELPPRKACSAPTSPDSDNVPSLSFARPALSRVTHPATSTAPCQPSDESMPPAKRRRTSATHSRVPSSEKFSIQQDLVGFGAEGSLGEDDMDLESDSDNGSEHEVAKAVEAVDSSPSRPARSSLSPIGQFFPSTQPLKQMYSAYACSTQPGTRIGLNGL